MSKYIVIFGKIVLYRDYPTESEKEFNKKVWALRNPKKPLSQSHEAKELKEKNKRLEQYSADRKQLLREKKQETLKAVITRDQDGDEVEEEEEEDFFSLLFPQQTVNENPEIDHEKMNNRTVI